MNEDVAIAMLQRRTGDDDMLTGLAGAVDLIGYRLQPGPTVFIGQRLAGAHLGDVAGGMKRVAVLITPAQAFRQLFGDGALARAGDTHHDQRAWCLRAVTAHENSPEARPRRRARRSRRRTARGSRAGSRPQAPASGSRAFRRPRSRTAFRGRRRERAGSTSPAARTVRHVPVARQPPNAGFLRQRDSPETATPYGRQVRRPSAPRRT